MNMEELKNKRKSIKASITRIFSYCTHADATPAGISVRIGKLDEYYGEFEKVQGAIDALTNDEQASQEEAYRAQIEKAYFHIKTLNNQINANNRSAHNGGSDDQQGNQQIVALIDSLTANQTTLSNAIQTIATQSMTSSTPVNAIHQNTIQLPRISLPQFDGSNTNWIHFRDLFYALIHSNKNLSNVEKFEYLQSHIKGDALSMVKHLTLSNENYTVAWDLLKTRYNDSQQLKREYLKLLFDQPTIKVASVGELKRFVNNSNEAINALKALDEEVEKWNSILLFQLERKLDAESHALWLRSAPEKPTYTQFLQFVNKRLQEVETCHTIKPTTHQPTNFQQSNRQRYQQLHLSSTKQCPVCNQQQHPLYNCVKFKLLNVTDRGHIVKRNNYCYNCLHFDHFSSQCTRSSCKICNGKHNTLLHQHKQNDREEFGSNARVNVGVCTNNSSKITLLPTARCLILGSDNRYHTCRVLLDTGAQASLISERCVQTLRLKKTYDKTLLCGIGNENKSYTRGRVQIVLKSNVCDKLITTSALCLKNLTAQQPSIQIDSQELEYFKGLQLADPECNVPSQIDIILGANVFSEWFKNKQLKHPSSSASALYSVFGWVILGEITAAPKETITIAHSCVDISNHLQNFWKIEELNENTTHLSEEEQQAEDYYKNTVQRLDSGRYMVRLPFKTKNPIFVNTEYQAAKRLSNMETKFMKNENHQKEYKRFMDEYIKLDHMEVIDKRQAKYYLPHHSVIKEDSTTTKLRVVFDGSTKDATKTSLNEMLLVGPTIQKDIFDIITQFRKFKVAVSADIEKMYRQILVHPNDRPYQCIMWRPNCNSQVKTFQLKTVTYGTSAAPFLAVRTLNQIAIDVREEHPKISQILTDCFYVDDLMFSTTDETNAVKIKNQLCQVLSNAGFHLRKWCSNSKEVLSTINNDDRELSSQTKIDDNQTVKTLGLFWDTVEDVFKYSVALPDPPMNVTKRAVLSMVSRVFDPLGWLAPVVVTFKIFMQRLWLCGMEWDTPLTDALQHQWMTIYHSVNDIKRLKIPRWLTLENDHQLQLHGFADASELAYAAIVYIKVIRKDGSSKIRLVAAKTRVAPVKQITLPRLELCACQLLAKLFQKVKNALQLHNVETHGWTDSTIVLAWLAEHPRKWKNFIANRTSYIINMLPAQHWHHISSASNPADLATRGVTPLELEKSNLWWNGPLELKRAEYAKKFPINHNAPDLEVRKHTILHVKTFDNSDIIQRYSDFTRLIRITATILRFITNCKSVKTHRQVGFLKACELRHAHNKLIKHAQSLNYKSEVATLQKKSQLPNSHQLAALNPFIDDEGLMRVGGRLENANVSFDQKHPFIMHKGSVLTMTIVRYFHIKYLHAGPRHLQYLLGLKYWIPSAMHVIKNCIFKCTICLRQRGKPFNQQMGDLPEHRLRATTAFENVGVDFAGPFYVRSWKGRGQKLYKSWIAVFVCLTIKAIHLEVVTELSTAAFIAALRRFVARRGKPIHIYSDNGTNFVGANQKLKEILHFMLKTSTQEVIQKETSELGIQWHFSPPGGPHFGGIWEAGVKSLKHYLYRVMGNASLTYEELNTIMCQVESCLNSRPLTARFEGDSDPLTPAHFLIMRPLQAVPDEVLVDLKTNRLTRWQLLQQIVQHFWKRWSSSYLTQLQNRPKWKQKMENLKIDDVVLLKDDLAPPCKWIIGRIIELHPGKDQLVRVVTVKTQKGNYKRPITKLCPLINA